MEEFKKKSSTNFIRNVRPRLQRLFPALYKGKDGNQRLLKDIRYLKISCSGKIPPETADEKQRLEELIRQGKNKVVKDTGMSPLTDNFLSSDDYSVQTFPDVVEESVSHAEISRASAATGSCSNTSVESSYHANQSIQGNPSIHQCFPQTTFVQSLPAQRNIPGFDFHSPFVPQPYYYLPQQQYIVPQYQPMQDPTILTHPDSDNAREHGTTSLLELAEAASQQ